MNCMRTTGHSLSQVLPTGNQRWGYVRTVVVLPLHHDSWQCLEIVGVRYYIAYSTHTLTLTQTPTHKHTQIPTPPPHTHTYTYTHTHTHKFTDLVRRIWSQKLYNTTTSTILWYNVDHCATYYSSLFKSVKWWRKVFLRVLQVAVINSSIIYKQQAAFQGQQPMKYQAFCTTLIDHLSAPLQSQTTRMAPTNSSKLVQNVSHFLIRGRKRTNCVVYL